MLIKEYGGLFRSPWILQLLAGHYDSISGAIRIPELEQIYSDEDDQALVNSLEIELATLHPGSKEALEVAIKLDIMRMYPRGALALCVIAVSFYNLSRERHFSNLSYCRYQFQVECALEIFTVSDNLSLATFSEKWNKQKKKYQRVIDTKLRMSSMEEIVLKACRYMKADTRISTAIAVLGDLDDEEMDDIDMFNDI